MPPSHPSLVPSRSTPPPPVGGAAGQSNVAEDTNDDAHAMRLSCSHLWAAARPARGGAGGEGCGQDLDDKRGIWRAPTEDSLSSLTFY